MLVIIIIIVIINSVTLRTLHLMKSVKLGLYQKHFKETAKYQMSSHVTQVLNEHMFIGEIVMRLMVTMIKIQGYQFVSVHMRIITLRENVNGRI